MKNGRCPKCNSSEVYAAKRTGLFHLLATHGARLLPIEPGVSTRLKNYVCASCGYVESYVTDPWVLGEIKKNWPKVN